MIDTLLSLIAPHLCLECRKIGTILCSHCAKNIVLESSNTCVQCEKLAKDGICYQCGSAMVFSKCWVVGQRRETLKVLVDVYKFGRTRAVSDTLADLLDKRLPILPADTVIVPIPTVAGHIRARGYDHCRLIAQGFAKRRQLIFTPLLERLGTTTQRGASRGDREQQARQAFIAKKQCDPSRPYLLIDDVITTGATVRWASRSLQEGGATTIWAAAVARQPLDD